MLEFIIIFGFGLVVGLIGGFIGVGLYVEIEHKRIQKLYIKEIEFLREAIRGFDPLWEDEHYM